MRVRGPGQRDLLRAHLAEREIGSEVYYPLTMDQQECFAELPASSREGNGVAHQLAGEVLSIPIYPELEREMQDWVVSAISEFLGIETPVEE